MAILNQFEPGQVAHPRSCGTQLSLFRVVSDAENTPRILRVASTSANSIATIQLKGPSCSRMNPLHWSGTIPIPVLENTPSCTASSAIRGPGSALAEPQDRLETLARASSRVERTGLGMDSGCIVLDLANAGRPLGNPAAYLDRTNARDTAELKLSRVRNEP